MLIESNELDHIFIFGIVVGVISGVIGITGFAISLFWDSIASSLLLQYKSGFGLGQCLLVGFWAMWIIACYMFVSKNVEYMKYYGKS